jgi:tRNA A-37 threonylcarbamoyl transferase component Bud32
MSRPPIRWQGADATLRAALDDAVPEAIEHAPPLHAGRHRCVFGLRLQLPSATEAVVKHYRPCSGKRRLREALKRVVGRDPARREWHALGRLQTAGLRVPRPLAWGEGRRGEAFVVTERLRGRPLAEELADTMEAPLLRQRLVALSETLEALHDAGLAHGDLHLGNLWWGPEGVWLLDVGHTRPILHPKDRDLDRARLEFSLARSLPDPRPVEMLRSLWPASSDLDAVRIDFLRDYQRGRARRHLRIGRDWERTRVGRARGVRDHRLPEARLEDALESCNRTRGEARRDGRVVIHRLPARSGAPALVVKRVEAGRAGRALADRLRGSAAARAFRAGQRRRLLDAGCAPPLAYLDETRIGIPVRSWLVLESVGREDLDQHRPASAKQAAATGRALGHWLATQHAAGLGHRDLKGSNLRITPPPAGTEATGLGEARPRFFLLDLEEMTGPAPIPTEARLTALSQLNASLSDEAFGDPARLAALEAYAARLPFDVSLERVARRIIDQSLARAHRWTGGAAVSARGEARKRASEP